MPRPFPFSESLWIIFLPPDEPFFLLPPAYGRQSSIHTKPVLLNSVTMATKLMWHITKFVKMVYLRENVWYTETQVLQ